MRERLPGLAYMLKQARVVCVRHPLPQKKQALSAEKAALEKTLLTKGSELQGISQSFLENSRLLLDYHRKRSPKAVAESLADDHSVLKPGLARTMRFYPGDSRSVSQTVCSRCRQKWLRHAWSRAAFCPRKTACKKQSLVPRCFMVRKYPHGAAPLKETVRNVP